MKRFINHSRRSRSVSESGVALVLVLCFVVLITGLVLALLSRSISSGYITGASTNGGRSDIYARGAVNQIVGDLREEVVAGSVNAFTVTAVTPNTHVYRPTAVTNSVPYPSGPYATTAKNWTNLPNLVKESYRGTKFESTGTVPERAAAASTTSASRNGRSVSLAQWNEALLLPKASTTINSSSAVGTTISEGSPTIDTTPNSTTDYFSTPPDWILTAVDGSNPGGNSAIDTGVDFTNNKTTSNVNPLSPKYVVGRYAYTIYNEGGLLDANAAGSPNGTGVSGGSGGASYSYIPGAVNLSSGLGSGNAPSEQVLWSRKGSEAFADLAVLPGIANTSSPLAVVNALVGWRNVGTAQQSGYSGQLSGVTFASGNTDNFFNNLLGLSTRFMTATTDPITNVPDRMFSTRQQLISFMQGVAGNNTSDAAYLQDAMMYLGTFTRSLNQPSYYPDPTRPMVLSAQSVGAGVWGNSAFGADNIYNPGFKTIRVTTGFTRADGTAALVGDPLVKKRFALSRLLWLTYEGPSATVSTGDPLYLQYQKLGMPTAQLNQLWKEGTATNIMAYFGLSWVPGPGTGGIGGYWYYNHTIAIGGGPLLAPLRYIGAAGREPDFFELLEAATTVGGIAKSGSQIGSWTFTNIQDSTVYSQIMQLGANIIDEANPGQYPTHIVYPFSTGGVLRSAYGTMDLPYLDSVANVRYIVQPSDLPTPAGAAGVPVAVAQVTNVAPASNGLYSADNGTGVFMFVPSIWNPYDVNGPQAPQGLAPQNLRIVLSPALTTLNQKLSATNSSVWSIGPTTSDFATSLGGTYPLTILPEDTWGSLVQYAPASTQTTTSSSGSTTTTNTTYFESPGINGTAASTGIFKSTWTSEASTELDFNNTTPTLYREPTALIRQGIPIGSSLSLGAGNAITASPNLMSSTGVPEMNGSPVTGSLIGFLGCTYPLRWTQPAMAGNTNTADPYFLYTVNNILPLSSAGGGLGLTLRLEYKVGSTWVPYMEYFTQQLQYSHDFVPVTENGTESAPYELLPNDNTISNNQVGSLWNGNRTGSPGGQVPGIMLAYDCRTSSWGFPVDVGPPRLFLDGYGSAPISDTMTTIMSTGSTTGTNAGPVQNSHSAGTGMVTTGWYEPTGGVVFGLKQQNIFSASTIAPSTDFYADPDGTVRRASGGYAGGTANGAGNINGSSWTWSSGTTGLPLASTVYGGAVGTQSQSRPIILHRPYRSVAELGYVFSNMPYKNISFSTPESPYSALLDTFCINEDYRTDAIEAGRVDLNTKQAPVIQALLAGAYRDEENNSLNPPTGAVAALSNAEAIALSQGLVQRTTVGNTRTDVTVNTNGPQPLTNIADLVGRWVPGGTVGTTLQPINGSTAYDGFSGDLNAYYAGGSTAANSVIPRLREATMRALSDAGQVGNWNLLIDVVAQSGRYPTNAADPTQFLVEGQRHYWVHVAIDRTTSQIIDENIEPVNQ